MQFNPIRAALVMGDSQRAHYLLRIRQQFYIDDPLDNLFWMRYYLLEDKPSLAAQHHRQLMLLAVRFGLVDRVELELRMACEMPLSRLGPTLPEHLSNALHARTNPVKIAHVRVDAEPRQRFGIIGASPAIQRVRDLVALYAPEPQPVLILGPTGVGKDLIARAIHEASQRQGEPFVPLNCAAVSDGLLEAELFGHARGAYTGADEARHGLLATAGVGTVFLDEIGDTSPRFQSALLRVLENGEYTPLELTNQERSRAESLPLPIVTCLSTAKGFAMTCSSGSSGCWWRCQPSMIVQKISLKLVATF